VEVMGNRRLRASLVTGVLLALLAVTLSACGEGAGGEGNKKSASGDSDATNGQVVFRRYLDPDQSKGAIFTMNPDGSHVSQITPPPNGWSDEAPVWSPDGTKVAFYRGCLASQCEEGSRIMVVDANTGDTRKVTHCMPDGGWTKEHPKPSSGRYCVGDSEPAFSPDGESIAFKRIICPCDKNSIVEGIFIVGLDGSNPHQVTNVEKRGAFEFEDFGSAFSPDGKMLVFGRERRQRIPKLGG
jgi:Tol biopolymer transport system component